MSPTEIIKKLSVLALVLEIIHRAIIALTNMFRMLLSEDYRKEIFENELPPLGASA